MYGFLEADIGTGVEDTGTHGWADTSSLISGAVSALGGGEEGWFM